MINMFLLQLTLNLLPAEILNFVRCKCKIDGCQPAVHRFVPVTSMVYLVFLLVIAAMAFSVKNKTEIGVNLLNLENDDQDNDQEDHNMLGNLIPGGCIEFSIPWIYEEEMECE